MVDVLKNPFRGTGLPAHATPNACLPSVNAEAVAALLNLCPAHRPTPLIDAPDVAAASGVGQVALKDERRRMGLGSFKALGASYAIAREAAELRDGEDWARTLEGRVFVTASAGNHGLSVAAGARLFGARAVVFLSETVPDAFADRLRAKGADVVRDGATYEDSMAAAERAAARNGWQLLSDSSWPGYTTWPHRVMEGYLQLAAETADALPIAPSHILLQAGVGGMAAAVAAYARRVWGDRPEIIVVEPEVAPALFESIRAGHLVTAQGPVSSMGRLDCKTPSMIALTGLARDADQFVTISEEEARRGVQRLDDLGLATTPSGAAGLAALLAGLPGLGAEARVLAILSEGTEDG